MNSRPINTDGISATKPFERFRQFTKQIVAVPKSEIDRRESEWKKQRATEAKKNGHKRM